MERLLRRHLWALDALAVVACACLAAHTTATLIEGELVRAGAAFVVPHPAPPASPTGIEAVDSRGETIVRRNIFRSSRRPGGSAAEVQPSPCAREAARLSFRLLAIMYAPPPADPRWSTAILKRADGAVGAYGVGSSIAGATIEAIDEARIALRTVDGGRSCLALIDGLRAPAPPPIDAMTAELDAGILRTGEHSYDVQRSTLESLLGKLDGGPPAARLEPDRRGGETVGFRLRDVRAGGPIAKIGLREGDVIASINGLATTIPQNALAIYASLRSVDHVSVTLQRDGRSITAEYDIQ